MTIQKTEQGNSPASLMVVTVTVTEAAEELVKGTSLLQVATTAADIAGNVPTLVHSTTIS